MRPGRSSGQLQKLKPESERRPKVGKEWARKASALSRMSQDFDMPWTKKQT